MSDIFKLTPHTPVHGCGCYKPKPLSGLDFTSSPALMGLAILGVAAVAYLTLSGSSSPSHAMANRRRARRNPPPYGTKAYYRWMALRKRAKNRDRYEEERKTFPVRRLEVICGPRDVGAVKAASRMEFDSDREEWDGGPHKIVWSDRGRNAERELEWIAKQIRSKVPSAGIELL